MTFFYYKKGFDKPLDCPACAAGAPKKEIVAFRPDPTKYDYVLMPAAKFDAMIATARRAALLDAMIAAAAESSKEEK